MNNQEIKTIATLKLTSSNLKGNITSEDTLKERNNFFKKNHFSDLKKSIICNVFQEAKINQFTVQISYSK